MDLRDFNGPIKYGASLQNSYLASGKILAGNSSNLAQEVTPSGAVTMGTDGAFTVTQGVPFFVTTAAGSVAIGTGFTLLTDAAVTTIGAGKSAYIEGLLIANDATAVTQTIVNAIQIQDGAGTVLISMASGGSSVLGASERFHGLSSGSLTLGTRITGGTVPSLIGTTKDRGIKVALASAAGIASGTINFMVWGIIK